MVTYFRSSNGIYYHLNDSLLGDGVDIVEVTMSVICSVCGEVKPHGVTVIHGSKGAFVTVCAECYMDADEYMEEMRGCGCGGNCE